MLRKVQKSVSSGIQLDNELWPHLSQTHPISPWVTSFKSLPRVAISEEARAELRCFKLDRKNQLLPGSCWLLRPACSKVMRECISIIFIPGETNEMKCRAQCSREVIEGEEMGEEWTNIVRSTHVWTCEQPGLTQRMRMGRIPFVWYQLYNPTPLLNPVNERKRSN